MHNTFRVRFGISVSDNRKSKTCTELSRSIQNRKWIGCLAILLLLMGWVRMAEAQQSRKIYRIGVLTVGAPGSSRIEAFRQGMKELGYVEGRHFALEIRLAEEKPDQYPKLAAELVGLPVDVIVTTSTALTSAAKNATKTIPIVMQAGNPVGVGLVASLARPGGNITGLTSMSGELGGEKPRAAQGGCPQDFPRGDSNAGRRKQ